MAASTPNRRPVLLPESPRTQNQNFHVFGEGHEHLFSKVPPFMDLRNIFLDKRKHLNNLLRAVIACHDHAGTKAIPDTVFGKNVLPKHPSGSASHLDITVQS
jgi:hypothetical protein